jgi:hypothetical protein
MKEFLLRAVTLVAALICGTIVGMYVFPWGLCVAGFVIWPLTLVVAALSAAIGAGWVGILLAPDHTSSRLLPVVIASEVAAIFMVVATPVLIPVLGLVPLISSSAHLLGAAMVVIGLTSSWAAWRFRSSGHRWARDALLTVGLAGLGVLVFKGTLYIVYLLGLASC